MERLSGYTEYNVLFSYSTLIQASLTNLKEGYGIIATLASSYLGYPEEHKHAIPDS